MKILVIGHKGMLGSMLMDVLADFSPEGMDKEEIDITNEVDVMEKITVAAPEVIINAAAYTAVDKAEEERELNFAVNEGGIKNIVSAAKKVGSRVIHYSTDYVFPGTKSEGYAEDNATGPAVNAYGEAKLAGEKALIESGVPYYLLRTAWLYGSGGKNFVDTMLRLGNEGKPLRVINDQHGSPTFTKDVALATKQLLEEKKPDGIYHAVCEGQATWFEFAQEIFRLKNITVNIAPVASEEYPLPAKRPEYSRLLNTKGLSMRDWKIALQDYLSNN